MSHAPTPEGAAPRANILAVDDTPANLTLLCSMLKDAGYRPRPASSGAFALTAATAEPPDLVLLDISMPEMDGFEVCRRLKADPRLREIPVIFLTAHTEARDKVEAFAVGGVDYITKPFQVEEVQARVATHLGLRRQKRALEESYARLVALERLREDLTQMMVHDLRSPLTALCLLLEFLLEDSGGLLPREQKADLHSALASARAMVDQVGAILDIHKMEAGRLVPRLEACDLLGLVEAVARTLRPMVGTRELTVTGPAGPTAQADPELVSRVVQNLLANALSFTPPRGRVDVVVEVLPDAARVSVADTGPGVAAEDRERIFEKFGPALDRAEGRRSARRSTGLGLAFCKMAVEAHGGAIGVTSEAGRGSTFWFVLPRSPRGGDPG